MNEIESYDFGRIVISGKTYTSDLIIFPDRMQSNWRRDDSHKLTGKDITGIINENPEILLVGTGAWGLMQVLPDAEQEAETQQSIKTRRSAFYPAVRF